MKNWPLNMDCNSIFKNKHEYVFVYLYTCMQKRKYEKLYIKILNSDYHVC